MYASLNRVSISSDNGVSSIQRQTIIYTNAGLLSSRSLGTSVTKLNKIRLFSFIRENASDHISSEMAAILFRGKWVKPCTTFTKIDCIYAPHVSKYVMRITYWHISPHYVNSSRPRYTYKCQLPRPSMVREMVQWLPEVIIWIKSSILLIESFSINISETWLKTSLIHRKMHTKMSSAN